MLPVHRAYRKTGAEMTYSAAIAGMKTAMTTAKASIADAVAALYSVESPTKDQSAEITNMMNALTSVSASVMRLESTPTPATPSAS